MYDYILDVLITSSTYVTLSMAILIGLPPILSGLLDRGEINAKSTSRRVAFVVLVVGIVLSVMSPTNTPKNTPHDREAFRIVPEQSIGAKVQDLTKQPKKTDEERKADFDALVDWKSK